MTLNQDPIVWQTVEDALFDWAHGVTGIEVTWANQPNPQLTYPFATLNITSGPTEIGTGDEKRPREIGSTDRYENEIRGQREMTVSIQIDAGSPESNCPKNHGRALADKLLASLSLDAIWQALDVAGLSVIEPMPITDLSFSMNSDFIDRKGFDVRFGLASSIVEGIDVIEIVEHEGTVTDAATGTLTVGPITIDSTT